MGSGSTVAAAEAVGYSCLGVERLAEYFSISQQAITQLAQLADKDSQLDLAFAQILIDPV